jgi:hypothetical protein
VELALEIQIMLCCISRTVVQVSCPRRVLDEVQQVTLADGHAWLRSGIQPTRTAGSHELLEGDLSRCITSTSRYTKDTEPVLADTLNTGLNVVTGSNRRKRSLYMKV